MKMSTGWHKNRLKNWAASVDRKEREAAKLLDEIARDRKELEHLKAQIERAEREGKDGFDADRFLPQLKAAKVL